MGVPKLAINSSLAEVPECDEAVVVSDSKNAAAVVFGVLGGLSGANKGVGTEGEGGDAFRRGGGDESRLVEGKESGIGEDVVEMDFAGGVADRDNVDCGGLNNCGNRFRRCSSSRDW